MRALPAGMPAASPAHLCELLRASLPKRPARSCASWAPISWTRSVRTSIRSWPDRRARFAISSRSPGFQGDAAP